MKLEMKDQIFIIKLLINGIKIKIKVFLTINQVANKILLE